MPLNPFNFLNTINVMNAMELDISIQKLGKIPDVFSFFKYLVRTPEITHPILLESVEEQTHAMMFSFIGVNPDFLIKGLGNDLKITNIRNERGEKLKEYCETTQMDPIDSGLPFEDSMPMEIPLLDKLKNMFPISRSAIPELFPRKIFSGGLLGYIGYDVIAPYVGYTPDELSRDRFPDIMMGLYTSVFAYSHATSSLYYINNTLVNSHQSYPSDLDVQRLLDAFKSGTPPMSGSLKKRSKKSSALKTIAAEIDPTLFRSNTSTDQWDRMIEKTKDHVYAGDIVQAVLSRQLITENAMDPLNVYECLRQVNPSPYMFYLNFDNVHNGSIRLLGSSPEALVTKDHTTLQTVPIAGTRRRGRTPEDEIRMEQELLSDEKELAEHIMLVDLARNDLARISLPGTVETYELIELRKYPSVMHLISKVRSQSHLDPVSILKSMFPAGTVSGAPKKRALEIIQKLEQSSRGPYAGCVGYIGFSGDMDMAISIRTIFNKDKTYIAQAGAGIVADSKPALEYIETENKLRGTMRALSMASQLDN
jgi:anthranilate synthase component 1